MPNAALMGEDAQPKQEEAEARAARKAAKAASSQVSAGEPSLANMAAGAGEEQGQAEVSSAAPSRRYSTRSAAAAEEAQAADADASTTPQADPVAERRMSLRRLRTPMQMAHSAADEEAATPQAPVPPPADTPVAQDASPQLAESPGFAAAAATPGDHAYSLRPSTLQKTRQSVGTPLAPANATPAAGGRGKEPRGDKPQLSPTEQGIRASLRRSARKSKAGGGQ